MSVNPSTCLHQRNHLYFPDTGHKWYVCDDCGTFLQASELALYCRIAELEADLATARQTAQGWKDEHLAGDATIAALRERNTLLKAVADAVMECEIWEDDAEKRLDEALRAAGYLGGMGNE